MSPSPARFGIFKKKKKSLHVGAEMQLWSEAMNPLSPAPNRPQSCQHWWADPPISRSTDVGPPVHSNRVPKIANKGDKRGTGQNQPVKWKRKGSKANPNPVTTGSNISHSRSCTYQINYSTLKAREIYPEDHSQQIISFLGSLIFLLGIMGTVRIFCIYFMGKIKNYRRLRKYPGSWSFFGWFCATPGGAGGL